MNGRPRGPRGRALSAAVAAAALAAVSAGCGGSGGDAPGPSRSAGAAAQEAGARTATPTASRDDVPVLAEGESTTVRIPGDDTLGEPATEAEVTLTGLKQADRLPQGEYLDPETAEPGTTFVCLEFKVENTGGAEFDTAPLTRARWTGEDGETTTADQHIGGDCEGVGLEKEFLLNEAEPRPGEFVRGTTLLVVPDGRPGTLEFADDAERPLFRVETNPAP
ncbi:DUF4352 domain-containing protein [Streptomyces genisteinicus]|uniref:DUF4352 domain-containing protein n=1 Tax=Streptomyces genisteinicus TaxID=2768068 RepID=UPI001FE4E229|nr:DUF4352 domain-containing protein [Streptomyces genisteinicus]